MLPVVSIDGLIVADGNTEGLEARLARAGLVSVAGSVQSAFYFSGCGAFTPGVGYSELLIRHQQGTLLGCLGLSFTDESISGYAGLPELRAAYGRILQLTLSQRIFVEAR